MTDEVNENAVAVVNEATAKEKLKEESQRLLYQIIEETDCNKTKDLTVLFNINQTKKTMARVEKLSELADVITDNLIKRFTEKPDNFSGQEMLTALKTVQDALEKSTKQVNAANEAPAPLIQINQQDNSVNVGPENMSRDSREKVKNVVTDVLKNLGIDSSTLTAQTSDVIDATEPEEEEK